MFLRTNFIVFQQIWCYFVSSSIYRADVLAVITGLVSLFGLPWMVASAVPSLNHVRSLVVPETRINARYSCYSTNLTSSFELMVG